MARVVIDDRALEAWLLGPSGPVVRDLSRRAQRITGRAKELAPVDTGRLRASIDWRLLHDAGVPVARVGTNVAYARAVHNGTRPHIIERRGPMFNAAGRVRTLRFPAGRGAKVYVFRRRVHHPGTTGRPFLRDALVAGL